MDPHRGARPNRPRRGPRPQQPIQRDAFIDFIRAFSLLVVVVWHWAFTIIVWERDGPHATSPLGFTSGLWVITWLFQVMPLFFFVGGYANLRAYQSGRRRGRDMAQFVEGRVRQLAIPSIVVTLVWVGIGVLVAAVWNVGVDRPSRDPGPQPAVVHRHLPAADRAASRLLYRLHVRFGPLVLVFLVGLAAVSRRGPVRARRRRASGWANMVLVWGLCFQLGFFYPHVRALAAP